MIELQFDMSVQLNDTEKLSALLRSIADKIDNGNCGSKVTQDGLAGQWRLYDPYERLCQSIDSWRTKAFN